MKTDKELYEEFMCGEKDAFEELVLRHKNNMIYFISRYIKDINIAEDISQDVFVYVLLNKEKYNNKFSFKTYLYTIAKCRAINYIKREKKIVSMEEIEKVCSNDYELEELIYSKEETKKLKENICKLKSDYQLVIYLVDVEKLTYTEVAKVMGKTAFQIKTLIHNARTKLKKIYEEEMI